MVFEHVKNISPPRLKLAILLSMRWARRSACKFLIRGAISRLQKICSEQVVLDVVTHECIKMGAVGSCNWAISRYHVLTLSTNNMTSNMIVMVKVTIQNKSVFVTDLPILSSMIMLRNEYESGRSQFISYWKLIKSTEYTSALLDISD